VLVATTAFACGSRSGLPIPEPTDPPGPDQCVSLRATAEIADLDVFIMMDSSGSMDYATAQGTTKWQAVRDALAAFLQDSDSQGVGAAISFFPVVDEAVPLLCDAAPVCGVPDACQKFAVCLPSGGELCDSTADCVADGFPEDTCHKIGFCEDAEDQACLPDDGGGCSDEQGACLDVGLCKNHYQCSVAAYDKPVVDVGVVPGISAKVLQAIDSRMPNGGTTTLPALQGAIARAAAWAQANPSHKSIVVLATDGLPTHCDPALDSDTPELGITHLVEAAAGGASNGVQTFVIGVFGPDEQGEAAPNLDFIASGGGTENAFVINTEDNVTENFLAALSEVRITAKSCEFAIPLVDGALPDVSRLTVQITPAGGEAVTIPRRGSEAKCDAQTGGFYYDKDPDGPVPPARVILCPASCGLFGSATNRTVDLLVACDEGK